MLGRQVAFGVFVVLFSLCASCDAETTTNGNQEDKSVIIPLDQIWAYNMPGTLNVRKIDPAQPDRFFEGIRRSLRAFPSKTKDARAGFAVSGTGVEALRQVHAVLVEKQDPEQTFLPNSEIFLAFFSYQNHPYVHVHRVEVQGHVVNIHYQFVLHETEEATTHFALIPVGKLPTGEYRVNVIQSPLEQKPFRDHSRSDEVARRIVCNSFSFSIGEQGE